MMHSEYTYNKLKRILAAVDNFIDCNFRRSFNVSSEWQVKGSKLASLSVIKWWNDLSRRRSIPFGVGERYFLSSSLRYSLLIIYKSLINFLQDINSFPVLGKKEKRKNTETMFLILLMHPASHNKQFIITFSHFPYKKINMKV